MADIGVISSHHVVVTATIQRCGCDPATFDENGYAPHAVESMRTGEGVPCPNPRMVEEQVLAEGDY